MSSPFVPSHFNETDFIDFSSCLQTCANTYSIEIDKLDDRFSESKICDTLKEKSFRDFVKCFIDKCNIDDLAKTLENVIPSRTDDSHNEKDFRGFNCPGLDIGEFLGGKKSDSGNSGGDQPGVNVKSASMGGHSRSAFVIAMFALFFM